MFVNLLISSIIVIAFLYSWIIFPHLNTDHPVITLEPVPGGHLCLVDRPKLVRGEAGLQHLVQGERLQAESRISHGGSWTAFAWVVGGTRHHTGSNKSTDWSWDRKVFKTTLIEK